MCRKLRFQVRWDDSFLKGSELPGLDAMLVKCMQGHLDMLMTLVC